MRPGAFSKRHDPQYEEDRMSQAARSGTDTGLLSREAARAIADRVLKMSAADQTRVTIVGSATGNTRFADASITTSGSAEDTSVTVTSTLGRRRASATTNILDDASLKRTVELAAQLARL